MFEPDGTLFGMPQERNWLGESGRKEDFGLPTARVDTRGGLIFGTWDRELPDFESYLGDFRFYFDMVFNSVDKHLVTTGPPQRWSADFNWKLGTENFLGDVYHTPTAHLSAADLGMMPQIDRSVFGVGGSDPAGGHGFYAVHPRSIGREPGPLGATLAWLPPEVIPQLDSHMDEAQMRLLREGVFPAVGSVFPNFSWIAMPTFFLLRLWSPAASGELEVYNWVVGHPDSSEEGRAMRDRGLNFTFGFTGILEQDDMVTWVRIQRGTRGAQSRRQFSSYACSRPADPTGFFPDGSDWPGPGEIRHGFVSDDHIWNFHLRWRECMRGDL
jgi:hypothetical protein